MGRAPEPTPQAELEGNGGPPPPTYELSTMGSPVPGSSSMAGSSSNAPLSPQPAPGAPSNDQSLSFDPSQAPDFSKPDLGMPSNNNSSHNVNNGSPSNNPFVPSGPPSHTNTGSNNPFVPSGPPTVPPSVASTPYQPQNMTPFPPATSAPQVQSTVSVTPLHMLKGESAAVQCPSCNLKCHTFVETKNGRRMHTIAGVCCCFTCMGCFPYCCSSFKDVHHKCGNCGVSLATYHRGSRTDVHCYGK